MAKVIPKKSKLKFQLAGVTAVAVIAIYLYFAYSRDLFPFTKAFKRKLNKLIKGEEPTSDADLDKLLGLEEASGLVDEFGSIENPRGGTGARGIGETGSLSDPAIKGDLNLANLYQQELYRQLFLPFEDNPDQDQAIDEQSIVRGGDIPAAGTPGVPEPYRYPFPVDERLYDMYGLFPPGGSYGDRSDPYSPINGRPRKPVFNRSVLGCHDCPEGESWDNCMCRCAPVDEPRLMCYKPECECPGGSLGENPDYDGGADDPDDNGEGTHSNGGEPNCPTGYIFDSCRCKCVHPDTPPIQCIRNCTECPQDQWYSFCTDQCVSGRQRQCEPSVDFADDYIPDVPDIPEWLPDDVLAEIGDLRDLRDKLLQDIEDLRNELQAEIDELKDQLEEEVEKRRELEETVQEIREELAEEERDPPPPQERVDNNDRRERWLQEVKEKVEEARRKAEEIRRRVSDRHARVTAAVAEVNNVDRRIRSYSYAGNSSTMTVNASGGSGTTASAGGGSATACAGGHCITAGQAKRRAFLATNFSRRERQLAFSNLQHKGRRMRTLKDKPTSFLKNKQLLNVLPPVVAKRHMASRLALS